MRIYAISDIHIDYQENYRWLINLSDYDYKNDVLILAGDLTNKSRLIKKAFKLLKNKFRDVLFVPGNHELWVLDGSADDSIEKLKLINGIMEDDGIITKSYRIGNLTIIPLYSWYDYSFGEPSDALFRWWVDYRACIWPRGMNVGDVARHFLSMNEFNLDLKNQNIITFSHFLPRIDVLPSFIPVKKRGIYPVLGSSLLNEQINKIKPNVHVYGHSHINMRIKKDGTMFINNAYGYPHENSITRKQLLCIYEL